MAPLAQRFSHVSKATKAYPAGRSLSFELRGNTITRLRLQGYPDAPQNWQDIQQFALDVHSALLPGGKVASTADALGSGALSFDQPSVITHRGESTTAWDEALDFFSLQVDACGAACNSVFDAGYLLQSILRSECCCSDIFHCPPMLCTPLCRSGTRLSFTAWGRTPGAAHADV
jgi:hypothetical protein